MKLIFLDIDGVLNCARLWARDKPKTSTYMTKELVARFKEMLDRLPDVKLVMSSTWRIGHYDIALDMLEEAGIPKDRFLGRTPEGSRRSGMYGSFYESVPRGHEIQMWLDANPGVEKFVIIDDNSDMAHLKGDLVQTTWDDGLQDHHVERIIQRLS